MSASKKISERVLEWEKKQQLEREAAQKKAVATGARPAVRSVTAPPKPLTPQKSKEEIEQEKAITKIQSCYRMFYQQKTYKIILKNHRYRTQVVEEILTTEKQYIRQLQLVVQNFLLPLRASAATPNPIISNEEIRTIFSTIEIIVATNQELLDELQKRMDSWHANQVIGDIFVKMAAFMKVYTNYVKNFNSALSCIQNCKSNLRFVEFCEAAYKLMESDIVDLPSFLISPVQRIPRYQLLLQDLLKHTWEIHPDFKSLSNALGEILTTASYVNEKQKEAENIQKVLSIQATLTGKNLKNLVDPHRRFVREGGLMEVNKKGKMVSRWFILFNDTLVKCKTPSASLMKKSKRKSETLEQQIKFEFVEQYSLASADVVNLGDEDQKKHGFEIITSETSLWLCAPSEEEKEAWVKDLNEEINSLKKKNEFYEEQHTKIASQRAAAAKALIAEQYTGYRVHGSNKYDSLLRENSVDKKDGETPFDSLAQRLELQRKAEERMSQLIEEERAMEAAAKERVEDFKNSMNRRYSTMAELPLPESPNEGRRAVSQQISAQDVKEYEKTQNEGGGKRRFASMKREDYRSTPGQAFSQSFTESSPRKEPKKGNFQLSPDKSATVDLGEIPGKRKFSSMKREDYRNRRTSVDIEPSSTESDATPPAASPISPSPTASPSAGGPQIGRRAFASLPRTDYRRLSANHDIGSAASPSKQAPPPQQQEASDAKQTEAKKEEPRTPGPTPSSAPAETPPETAALPNGTTEGSEEESSGVGRRRFSSITRVDYRGRTGGSNRSSTTIMSPEKNPSGETEPTEKKSKNKKKKEKRNTLTKKLTPETAEKKEPKRGNFALSPDKAATLDLGEVPRKRLTDDLAKDKNNTATATTETPKPIDENVPRRRFASMKREDYRSNPPASSSPSAPPQAAEPPQQTTPAPSTSPATTTTIPAQPGTTEEPKLRKFAAMKREHFKTFTAGESAAATNNTNTTTDTGAEPTATKKKKKKTSTLTKKKPPKPTKDK